MLCLDYMQFLVIVVNISLCDTICKVNFLLENFSTKMVDSVDLKS